MFRVDVIFLNSVGHRDACHVEGSSRFHLHIMNDFMICLLQTVIWILLGLNDHDQLKRLCN